MIDSETKRINEKKPSSSQLEVIPKTQIITQVQSQQSPTLQQPTIQQVITYQPYIQNQLYLQQSHTQPIVVVPMMQPNYVIMNQPVQTVLMPNNLQNKKSKICPYCRQNVEFNTEKSFNCCACLYYFFYYT